MVELVAPSSLDEVYTPSCGASFPSQVVRGKSTALCLFTAAFYGRQDVYWIAQAGLKATCVDLDHARLEVMERIYPDGWEFIACDAYDFADHAKAQRQKWDVVTVDPPSNHFGLCADLTSLWCRLADHAVILATGTDTKIKPPRRWEITRHQLRSQYLGGVYWTVLERA